MRTLAICGASFSHIAPLTPGLGTLDVDRVRVNCAIVATADRTLDRRDPANAHKVLIKVRAFSCNFRDKAQILKAAISAPDNAFYVLGSEFSGEVLETGPAVTRVTAGDRVMGDNSWPVQLPRGWRRGVPTNHASREYLVLHEEKLCRIPGEMPDEQAAAFSIGAQTAYSMVSKLDVHEGSNVLVTAATSNTSLFTIHALLRHRVNVYATTTSRRFVTQLLGLGVAQVFCVHPALPTFADDPDLNSLVARLHGFDGVVDPFFDLYLQKVLPVMAFGSRYVTCGFFDQYHAAGSPPPLPAPNYRQALEIAMVKNISIIGNCAGLRADLERAGKDYVDRILPVTVDSVFANGWPAAFLERTYNARDRFGKVVYRYD
jgi:NADPH:quinone reductase-like Zn-dependent oxidoreductase